MDPISIGVVLSTGLTEALKLANRIAEIQKLRQEGKLDDEKALLMYEAARAGFDAARAAWDAAEPPHE